MLWTVSEYLQTVQLACQCHCLGFEVLHSILPRGSHEIAISCILTGLLCDWLPSTEQHTFEMRIDNTELLNNCLGNSISTLSGLTWRMSGLRQILLYAVNHEARLWFWRPPCCRKIVPNAAWCRRLKKSARCGAWRRPANFDRSASMQTIEVRIDSMLRISPT